MSSVGTSAVVLAMLIELPGSAAKLAASVLLAAAFANASHCSPSFTSLPPPPLPSPPLSSSPPRLLDGITLLCGIIDDPEAQLDSQIVNMLGKGSAEIIGEQSSGDGRLLFMVQRYGSAPDDRRAKLMGGFVRDRPGMVAEELDLLDISLAHISAEEHPEAVARCKAALKSQMGDRWPQMYHDMIDVLEPMQLFDLHQCPADAPLDEASTLRMICIGDALHGMSPTSGSGGNLAVADAGDLATYLLDVVGAGKGHSAEFMSGLRAVEKACLARSDAPAKRGRWNSERMKAVITTKGPVRSWYTSTSRFEGLGWRAETMFKAFQWVHWLEGWGGMKRTR